ncbi:MAG: TATA-box-binding protein [Candidatus Diapherotrites archaeon]|nr:TATA-box-binding protein [Candidatus Diapherotrites archaeon]
MKYTIVNLVAASDLKATLDLYNLAISIPEIEYEPEQFPGAILKLKEPKVSMLLFKNGKIICSGASSEKEIAQGIRKASKLIHEIQPDVKVQRKVSYEVVNLVATANLNLELDLFQIAMKLDNVEYEPEQFPGAILRIDDPPLTMLLFKNGKMICAGAKREYLLRKGLRKAEKIIKSIVKPKKTRKRTTKRKKKKQSTKKKGAKRKTTKRKKRKATRKKRK